jgi:hypothetical protein
MFILDCVTGRGKYGERGASEEKGRERDMEILRFQDGSLHLC